MSAATITRGVRLFVLTSALWFILWQIAVFGTDNRRVIVTLAVYGFIFHMIFGKAYALIPSYFDRSLVLPRAPMVHAPLAVFGTIGLTLEATGVSAAWVSIAGLFGAFLWGMGCLLFIGTIIWTVRNNLTGNETGTAESKEHLRGIDRLSNALFPFILLFLLIGAGAILARVGEQGSFITQYPPLITHIFVIGVATLLVFGLGFRLLPRFFVTTPNLIVVAFVLGSGLLGAILLLSDFQGGIVFLLGAVFLLVSLSGFATVMISMYWRSNRRRVGLSTVLVASIIGPVVALLGLHMAITGIHSHIVTAHLRLGLLGFLGLTIVGVSYQFYPPAVSPIRWIDDRVAKLGVLLLVVGLSIEVGGILLLIQILQQSGQIITVGGAAIYGLIILSVMSRAT